MSLIKVVNIDDLTDEELDKLEDMKIQGDLEQELENHKLITQDKHTKSRKLNQLQEEGLHLEQFNKKGE